MSMLSALYHEGQANEKAAQQRREAKYGGEQETDTVVDLSEPMIPGILVKKIVRVGNGEIPPVGSVVRVHYTGKLKDGTKFDSSADRGPLSFSLGRGEVIRGWDYAVSTMQMGEKAILTVGPQYGYGASGTGPIPPNATLTFDMEVMDWDKPKMFELHQLIAALFIFGVIMYVLFFHDKHDTLMIKSSAPPQRL